MTTKKAPETAAQETRTSCPCGPACACSPCQCGTSAADKRSSEKGR